MSLPRIEKEPRTRAGLLKLEAWFSPNFNPLRNSDVFAYRVSSFGNDLGFAEKMGFHVFQF